MVGVVFDMVWSLERGGLGENGNQARQVWFESKAGTAGMSEVIALANKIMCANSGDNSQGTLP